MSPSAIPNVLAFALFVGLNFYGYYLFHKPGPAEPETMGAILTPQNAELPVALTASERSEAMSQCISAFRTQDYPGIIHYGKPEDVENMLVRFAGESCGCMLRGLEKRTTTLEFVLAMAMQFSFSPRDDYASFTVGSAKKREQILPFAHAAGLTNKQFDAAGVKAEAAVSAAGTSCMETQS